MEALNRNRNDDRDKHGLRKFYYKRVQHNLERGKEVPPRARSISLFEFIQCVEIMACLINICEPGTRLCEEVR